MIIATAALIAVLAIVYVLGVRQRDLPAPEPASPFARLDERKAVIYENLRDLQFEYRLGKLSDQDYQSTKQDLQKELAAVLAEVDQIKAQLSGAGPRPAQTPQAPALPSNVCPACGAKFEKALKFCGECGKPMQAVKS